jgi:hypothetical protein
MLSLLNGSIRQNSEKKLLSFSTIPAEPVFGQNQRAGIIQREAEAIRPICRLLGDFIG